MAIAMRLVPCLTLCMMLSACSSSPAPRMEAYLGPALQAGDSKVDAKLSVPDGGFAAALVVLNDPSGPNAAPKLSDESLTALTQRLQVLTERNFPIRISKVLRPDTIEPRGEPRQLVDLAQAEGADYLLLAIFSGAETEVPTQLPLQGNTQGGLGRGGVLGYIAENYALVELALLDSATGRPLVAADGRAWSTLERLNVPVESNVYPVVRRSQRIPPIFPTEENAKDVMRAVSADEAMDQVLMHFNDIWKERFSG